MASTRTLWTLQAQVSPRSDLVPSIFITIWAFSFVIIASLFYIKFSNSTRVWPNFRSIVGSTVVLAVWYTVTATDRWLHYEERLLPYGYILLEPVSQILLVISTILFLWGTYKIVWDELERYFEEERVQGAWWLAAKVSIFLVCLVSFYYVVLDIATAVVWLEFLSLNIIADVATKRNDFELAMTAFFTVFAILTTLATIATVYFGARKREGTWAKTRVDLVLATIMLFARSLAECVLVSIQRNGLVLRHDAQNAWDIAYGIFTVIYLVFMYLQALQLASKLDMGASDAGNVKSDVRAWILSKLSTVTDGHVLTAPPFSAILDEASSELTLILEQGPLSLTSALTPEKKIKVASSYIKQLRRQFPHLAPQPKTMPIQSQPANNRLRPTLGGRQSAPLMASSSAYESLRSNYDPSMRKPVSVPNLRGNRFAPRGLHESTSLGSSLWQPNIAPIVENQSRPQAAAYPSSAPVEHGLFAPADTNQPSFSNRAEAAGFGVPGQQQRRRFGPQETPIDQVGQAQFAAQQTQVYPPDSYAPQPHAYPAQSYSPQPAQQTYGYTPQPTHLSTQYMSQGESGTTLGAYSDTPARASETADYSQPSQPHRRRFEPGGNSAGASPPSVPGVVPNAEPSQQRYVPRFAPGTPPVQHHQAGLPPQASTSQFEKQRPAYAETVTDSDVASSRSPINFNYALPDLGQEDPRR